MKKLMIVAAVAAMAGVVSADTQVYDVKMNIKTTTCKTTNIAANQNPFRPAAGSIVYRTPGTLTIQGLIWACDCDYFVELGQLKAPAAPASVKTYENIAGGGIAGYVFWNPKTRAPFPWMYSTIANPTANPAAWTLTVGENMPFFSWTFLQRIGARAEQVEGSWELQGFAVNNGAAGAATVNNGVVPAFYLAGAGFGKASYGTVNALGTLECQDAIVSSMSGNLAGFLIPGQDDCVFCGANGCDSFLFCNCTYNKRDNTKTAAYGTWTIKFNSSLAKRLKTVATIREIYNFSDATDRVVRYLEANAK